MFQVTERVQEILNLELGTWNLELA